MPKEILLLALSLGALPFPASSQSNTVQPTVLAGQGDPGGKLFGHAPDPARTRHYYVAAERQLWDFAPSGRDVVCGMTFPPAVSSRRAIVKVRYVAYSDATFSRRVAENPSLGILGPALRGVVGDEIAVTFWNRADVPLSMHPHGVKYDKDNEGSYYQPNPGLGAAIAPGAKFTYVWQLDASSGPLPSEPSSKAWLYHSHVQGDVEANLGLIGFIIVTDPKRARPDGTPADVDRELASLFMIFDETGLTPDEEEAEENAAPGTSLTNSWARLQELKEEGQRPAINGRIYGNLTGLEMNAGERVRWYLFGLGSENDLHTPHWNGLSVIQSGHRTDTVELLPASMKVADMVADHPGSWLFQCHVAEHMMEGMFAQVIVHPANARAPGAAFFGLPAELQPLQIPRATASVDFAPNATHPCKIQIQGEVAIPNPFPIFSNIIRMQLGGQAVVFKPDRAGTSETPHAIFQAENASKNSSELGIVYGGLLKFRMELTGPDWRQELITAGLAPNSAGPTNLTVPLLLELGGAKHQATMRMDVSRQ